MKFNNINTVVQIGANVGNDELTPIIKNNKNTIKTFIAVEPLYWHNDSLLECYSDIAGFFIENVVISDCDKNKDVKLYYNTHDGPLFELTSVNPEHIKKHMTNVKRILNGDIKSISVKVMSINELFTLYNLKYIDLLVIDVEGQDLNLILDLNFDLFNIKCIIYEHIHIDNKIAIDYLKSKGYTIDVGWGKENWSSIAYKK